MGTRLRFISDECWVIPTRPPGADQVAPAHTASPTAVGVQVAGNQEAPRQLPAGTGTPGESATPKAPPWSECAPDTTQPTEAPVAGQHNPLDPATGHIDTPTEAIGTPIAESDQALTGLGLSSTEMEALRKQVQAALEEDAKRPRQPGEDPRPVAVVEITKKTMADRFYLKPDAEVEDIFNGVLGRAIEKTGVAYHFGHLLSNHGGLLVSVHSCDQLASLTHMVFQQTGKRIRQHLDLETRLWGNRYNAIVLSGDAAIQAARAKYCLANGTKEHLVEHPSQWPGHHSARLFCNNEALVGHWTNGTAFRLARRRDPNARIEDFKERYEVKHTKLPGFAHLSDEEYAAMVRTWCDEAAEEAAEVRRRDNLPPPVGPEALRKVDIYHRPENPARSPQPPIHTHDPAIRRRHVAAYKAYIAQHQALRAELRLHLAAMGVALPGGLAPTGWVPIDPATVVPPPAIALPDTSAAAD